MVLSLLVPPHFRYHNRFFNVGVLEIGTGTGLNLPSDISFWYWTWLDIGVGLPIITARDRSWVVKTSGNVSWRRSTYEELVSLGDLERTHTHTTRYDLRLDFLWRTPAISRIPLLRAYAKIDNQGHFTIGVALNALGLGILQWMY